MEGQAINIKEIQNKIDRLQSEYQIVKRQYKEEKKTLKQAKEYLSDVKQAQQIAQEVAQSIQRKAHKQLSGVVSLALKTVFGEDYTFRLDFLKKRNRTEAKLVLLKNGHEVGDPLEDDSGGVLDVGAGLGLRPACLMMHKPKLRKLLILDEPFKNLHSREYRNAARKMLEVLSKEFGIQFVIVTGIDDYRIGKVVEL